MNQQFYTYGNAIGYNWYFFFKFVKAIKKLYLMKSIVSLFLLLFFVSSCNKQNNNQNIDESLLVDNWWIADGTGIQSNYFRSTDKICRRKNSDGSNEQDYANYILSNDTLYLNPLNGFLQSKYKIVSLTSTELRMINLNINTEYVFHH